MWSALGVPAAARREHTAAVTGSAVRAGILTPEAYSATIWALLLATLLGPCAFRLSMKCTPWGLETRADGGGAAETTTYKGDA